MPHLSVILADSQFIHISDTHAEFGSKNALPLLVITTPFCKASILLQGAQILSYQPINSQPWLWLSPLARFEPGKSPRGGIPVCLPWFGVNQQNPDLPKHGFARNRDWQLLHWEESPESVTLEFGFSYRGSEPDLFVTPFEAVLKITLSSCLTLKLNLINTGKNQETFSWALHTYLAVDDCANTTVSGLEGVTFLDNNQGLSPSVSTEPIHFLQAVDRVYNQTIQAQILHARHTLEISGQHCPTCIVWNIGKEMANSLADIDHHYHEYVCVERGCAFDDRLQLKPNEIFTATMTLRALS